MELFGQNTFGLQLLDYKPPEPPEGVWRAIAQQKTTAGAEGQIAMGHGISQLGGAVKGFLDKKEKEAEASGDQSVTFSRNSNGDLVPTSSGAGGFLFGANGPSITGDWSPMNFFDSTPQEKGTAAAMGTSAAATGANVQSMANAQTVTSIYAANSMIGDEILKKRQEFEGKPEEFKAWGMGYADTLRDNMGGKSGLALYNAAHHFINQHYTNMVSQKFAADSQNQWDTISAGIKQDATDSSSFARQFPGSFEELKQSGPYQKVLLGYKSLNNLPQFKAKMTDGRLAEYTQDFQKDMEKSWAIGKAQRIMTSPGGSFDKAQAWAVKEFRDKGRDDIFQTVDNSLRFKTEAQKDAIDGNRHMVDGVLARLTTGNNVPTKEEVDAIADKSIQIGDTRSAIAIRDAYIGYQGRKVYSGLSPQSVAQSAATRMAGAPRLFGSQGMGLGAQNIVYRGGFDEKGPGGFSPNQAFTFLKSIGASDNMARTLVGASWSESAGDPNAWHDNRTGFGLFGHKLARLDMRGKNWQEQYRAAFEEIKGRPEAAAIERAVTPDELAIAQMHFEQPEGYTKANPTAGRNYTGRLNQIRRFYGLNGGAELEQIAAPANNEGHPRPFTPQELAARPYLAATYYGGMDYDEKRQVAYAKEMMPTIAQGITAGVMPPASDMAMFQQLAASHPEELAKPWADVQRTMLAHPQAMALAGIPNAADAIAEMKKTASETGNLSMLNFVNEVEKQQKAADADFKDNPQRWGARKDVGLIEKQPGSLTEAFSTPEFQTTYAKNLEDKRLAGIAITNRKPGTVKMANTIMQSDIKGMASLLTNSDAATAKTILQTMSANHSADELSYFEKNSDFKNAITSMANSTDIGKAQAAYQFMDLRYSENPEAFNANYPRMKERMVHFKTSIEGQDAKTAGERQRQITDPMLQTGIDANVKLAKEELGKMKPQDVLNTATQNVVERFGSWMNTPLIGGPTPNIGERGFNYDNASQALTNGGLDPSSKIALWGDFSNSYIAQRMLSNQGVAMTAAIDDVKTRWGVSDINGGRLMKYAPELYPQYFPKINGNHSWVNEQVGEVVSAIASKNSIAGLYWNPTGFADGITTSLHSDNQTRIDLSNNKPPSYGILLKTKDNQWIALTTEVNGKQQMVRYYPDAQAAMEPNRVAANAMRQAQGLMPMGEAPPAPKDTMQAQGEK